MKAFYSRPAHKGRLIEFPLYVITEPESIKGIYNTWDECKSKVDGVKGAKYQKVHDLAQAKALVQGEGIVLTPGLHVFTDGNHRGGVGVVIVWQSENRNDTPIVVAEIATSVGRVFYGGLIPELGTDEEVQAALQKSKNVLAELGGLYLALWQAPAKATLTIVHDYEGVASWMTGKWKATEPVVKAIIRASKKLVDEKRLVVSFQWQKGHTSFWAGRHDLARFNGRADELATRGAHSSSS
jgi:ribonuclease HI